MTKYSQPGPLKEELSHQASWAGTVVVDAESSDRAETPAADSARQNQAEVPSEPVKIQIPVERQAPEKNTAALADAKVARIAKQAATGQYIGYNKAGVVLGWLNYRDEKNRRVIFHTETNPIFRGKGVADHITKHAMEDAVAQDIMVEPSCWYAAEWVQRNPAYSKYIVNPAY